MPPSRPRHFTRLRLAPYRDIPSGERDAEYIAVARLQADALVTVDPDLGAKAADLVTVATFEDLFIN